MTRDRPSAVGHRQALLAMRTRRLARPRRAATPVPSTACLVCETGGQLYGLPIDRLSRVMAIGRVAHAPTRNPALLGVLARSGAFYHVFDLGRLLGAESGGEGGQVVLLRSGAPAIALRIDVALRVADLVDLPADATSQMGVSHPAVRGFAQPLEARLFEGRVISLVDVDVLTADADRGRLEGELGVDQ